MRSSTSPLGSNFVFCRLHFSLFCSKLFRPKFNSLSDLVFLSSDSIADLGRVGGGSGLVVGITIWGFDPLPTERVPLCNFSRYPRLVRDFKSFLKTHSAPKLTNFYEKLRANKTRIFGQHFSKSA